MRRNQRWFTASTIILWHHFYSTITQNCQNLTQLQWSDGVRVHLYAYVPHWKVLKHFINNQCGLEKESKVVNSLNHNSIEPFPLNSHQELPKSDPASALKWWKGALICLHTSLKGAKTLYICPMWMWEVSKVVYSLNHNIIASFPLNSYPELQKSDPGSVV